MIKNSQKGAVALMVVIIVTSLSLIFIVSLAIMQVDYRLSSGIYLLEQELTSATDACLEQGISAVLANKSITALNVNDIGQSDIDCTITVTQSGDMRHLLAKATSSGAFYDSGKRASTTVDLSTNPPTLVGYNYDVENPSLTLAYDTYTYAKTNISFYGAPVISDGEFIYLLYIDNSNSSKLTIARYHLDDLTVDKEIVASTSGSTDYPDAVINNGYLYYTYTYNDGSERMSIGRVPLNDFTTANVEVIENPYSDAVWDGYSTSIVGIGDYVYASHTNTSDSNKLEVWKVDTNNFTTDGITRRQDLSNGGNCLYVDSGTWNDFLVFSCRASATSNQVTIYMADSFDFVNSSVDEIVAAAVNGVNGAMAIQGDFAYVAFADSSDSYQLHLSKVNLRDKSAVSTTDSNLDDGYYAGITIDGNYAYVLYNNASYDPSLARFDLRDMSLDASLDSITTRNNWDRQQPVIVGKHLYYGGTNNTYWHSGIVRIDIE